MPDQDIIADEAIDARGEIYPCVPATPVDVLMCSHISSGAKLAYQILAGRFGEPTTPEAIAFCLPIGPSAARRYLYELRHTGWVTPRRRVDENGKDIPSVYVCHQMGKCCS